MTRNLLKIGTRKSKLALIQTTMFQEAFCAQYPDYQFEIIPKETSGDIHNKERLADIGGKGLFTKELDVALLEGRIDLAVHSLKDVETILPVGIKIGCVLKREDPRDAFISHTGHRLNDIEAGSIIGTASLRRQALLLKARPDLMVQLIRGNISTRLKKLETENFDGTFLAVAGLKRLGLEDVVTEILDPEIFVPAVGQGALAICIREDDLELAKLLGAINHRPTDLCIQAERALLKALGATCHTPIGAYATIDNGTITLRGFLGTPDGMHGVSFKESGTDPLVLGETVAERLRQKFLPHTIQGLSCFS